jgi:hypothetical protein
MTATGKTTTGRIGRIALGDIVSRTARTCVDEIALGTRRDRVTRTRS